MQVQYLALEGTAALLKTIAMVKRRLNPSLRIFGVLCTMYDRRTKISRIVYEKLRRYFHELLFDTIIYVDVKLEEAPGYGEPIFVYAPASRGAKMYFELAREVVQRASKEGKGSV